MKTLATKAITIAVNPIRLSLDVGAAGPVATHISNNNPIPKGIGEVW